MNEVFAQQNKGTRNSYGQQQNQNQSNKMCTYTQTHTNKSQNNIHICIHT